MDIRGLYELYRQEPIEDGMVTIKALGKVDYVNRTSNSETIGAREHRLCRP